MQRAVCRGSDVINVSKLREYASEFPACLLPAGDQRLFRVRAFSNITRIQSPTESTVIVPNARSLARSFSFIHRQTAFMPIYRGRFRDLLRTILSIRPVALRAIEARQGRPRVSRDPAHTVSARHGKLTKIFRRAHNDVDIFRRRASPPPLVLVAFAV